MELFTHGIALKSTINGVMKTFQISSEVAKLPQSRFLPRPPGHDRPLDLDQPAFHPKTSDDWLKSNGLKG